jgi:DNA-binding MarR family transcriptional regulator
LSDTSAKVATVRKPKQQAGPHWDADLPSPNLPEQTAAGQIARELGQIRRLLRKPLETEIAKGNLTAPQRAVMQVVVRCDGINLKDLSAQISLAQSTVSGIVDRLARDGLVERRPDPSDGRGTRIHPTAPVVEFMRETMPHLVNDPLQQAIARASTEEVTQIERALTRLRELLENTPSLEGS